MKAFVILSVAAMLALSFSVVGLAGHHESKEAEVTLEGNIVCAKCALEAEGQKECQNVLLVETDAKTKHFYLVKNDVYAEMGEVCMAKKPVKVTGTVSMKDDKAWLTATTITQKEEDEG